MSRAMAIALLFASFLTLFSFNSYANLCENLGATTKNNLSVINDFSNQPHTSLQSNLPGGVLFQNTARPAPQIAGKLIDLVYSAAEKDGHRLKITIGDKSFPIALYDWQLKPIARFADSPWTAAVTLFGKPSNAAELKWLSEHRGAFLVEFHPDLMHTMVGLNLFLADTLFVRATEPPSIFKMRSATRPLEIHLKWWRESFPGLEFNELSSLSAAEELNQLIHLDPRYNTWQSYMLTDADVQFSFGIKEDVFEITGVPYYYFWKKGEGQTVIPIAELNSRVRSGQLLLSRLNPFIFSIVTKVAQWSAVFKYIKQTHPEKWSIFLESLKQNQDTFYKVDTPRAWKP